MISLNINKSQEISTSTEVCVIPAFKKEKKGLRKQNFLIASTTMERKKKKKKHLFIFIRLCSVSADIHFVLPTTALPGNCNLFIYYYGA